MSLAPLLDPANADHIRQLLALPWKPSAPPCKTLTPRPQQAAKKARRPSA